MRVREADAANSLALRRWNFLLAVTSHHSNFMCTEEVAVSIHSLGSGTSHVRASLSILSAQAGAHKAAVNQSHVPRFDRPPTPSFDKTSLETC